MATIPRLSHVAFFASLFFCLSSSAEVSLNPLFGDHMVLQRERPVPVWGKASPGEKVSVVFGAETKTTSAGADGKWMVELSPLAVSLTPATLTVRGTNEVTVSDVLVGDVWLGTGQSNMDFSVSGTDGAERIKASKPGQYDGIRLFKVETVVADEPVEAVQGQWKDATTPNVMGFSAVLFFFAEELHQREPGVPLGLIRCSVGATNAYSWASNEVRDKDPSAAYLREWWTGVMRGWTPEKQAARDQEMKDYETNVAEYKSRHEKLPDSIKKPGEFVGAKWSRRPSGFYNGMTAPLQPVSVRGAIWYQGEWDAKHDWVKVYKDFVIAMTKDWRANWAKAAHNPKLGDFPIYIVQLPSRIPGDGDFWPFMREAEEGIAKELPDSGFVTTFDLNDGTNLHPYEKTEIGRRLAFLALAKEYGQNVSWHGPLLKSTRIDGKYIILQFDPGSASMKSSDGQPLRLFEIAGEDGKYVPANAELKGDYVRLSAPSVAKPATVRYAWAPTPLHPNLVNSDGLPASPFRTDKQPVPER
ncbi:MAG TPA: sialate O-acetylesterase [Rariglobus sp.]|jgi:sialate O-acetylesterase|nr:sialate O-acetylesterase [Rariglobus sp.]